MLISGPSRRPASGHRAADPRTSPQVHSEPEFHHSSGGNGKHGHGHVREFENSERRGPGRKANSGGGHETGSHGRRHRCYRHPLRKGDSRQVGHHRRGEQISAGHHEQQVHQGRPQGRGRLFAEQISDIGHQEWHAVFGKDLEQTSHASH